MVCKENQYVYNYITRANAITVAKSMYTNVTFKSAFMNSYAWDTALVFIHEFSGDSGYYWSFRLQTTLAKTGRATDGTNKDIRCNIYDMAGNCREYTTENYTNGDGVRPNVLRGEVYSDLSYHPASRYGSPRAEDGTSEASAINGFRPIIYFQ